MSKDLPKVISLFNHKGGVSKTTTTFHLGWKIARLGKKVLIVDADPQCNLTGLTLGIEDYDTLFKFYDSRRNVNIYDALAPAFGLQSYSRGFEYVEPTKTANENLFLLAGNIDFAKIDIQIATALTSSSTLPILKNFINAIYNLISETAKRNRFDVVLIDMSPSVSATNMCLVMGSDYFIVPTSPDFYCFQAINSLASILPEWAEKMKPFKDNGVLNSQNPKFIGSISQNYRVYGANEEEEDIEDEKRRKMTEAFEQWAKKIKEAVNKTLVPNLEKEKIDMVISRDLFEKYVKHDSPFNLANIPNFNSLVPISQSKSKPMFELVQEDHKPWKKGAIWERKQNDRMVGTKHNIIECNGIYEDFANSIINIINS